MNHSNEQIARLIAVTPAPRQIRWQELELTAFLHFGVNTFTDREWGDGTEDPAIFAPRRLDTDQWCAALREAGARGAILTAKHHDGFCLWDTRETDHSVMRSPFGRDVLALLADSCRRFGLKLGVYLSPWDRHDPRYGQGKPYDDYFCAQLAELLTGYGDIYCVWFDGACGEGPNGKRQRYDWERYFAAARALQPQAALSVCGPDVRWCGNEAGRCREAEWSVVPAALRECDRIAERSQRQDGGAFRARPVAPSDEDLGSRAALEGAGELVWYPAEVDTSIRPGWFYHPAEDGSVRSLEELVRIYLGSVGGNAALLLNVPPDTDGLLAAPDVRRLGELGAFIRDTFARDLLKGAAFTASSEEAGRPAAALGSGTGCWKALDGDTAITVTAEAADAVTAQWLMLMEDIGYSQRVERFALDAFTENGWETVCEGTTVGYKRLVRFEAPETARRWRLRIPECRAGAALKAFALYAPRG